MNTIWLIAPMLMLPQTSDYIRGVALIEAGTPEAAIAPLVSATNAQPEDARAWKALGVAYAATGQYDGAEPAFARACRLAPKLEDACYYHARTLYAMNRFEASLAVLEKAGGKSWKIVLARAQALDALGMASEAEAAFGAAMSSCGDQDPSPALGLGLFLVRQGRVDAALAVTADALKRFPKSLEGQIQMGRVLLDKGRSEEAARYLETAVTLSPQSTQAHLLLAKAYVRMGRHGDAQVHFETAARGAK